MFALLIPLALIGAFVFASRDPAPPVRALAAGATGPGLAPSPSPIAVLCVFLRAHREPPPFVVRCAIAEAELAGRHDLAATFGHLLTPAPAAPIDVPSAAVPAPAAPTAGDDQTIETAPVAPAMPPPTREIESDVPVEPAAQAVAAPSFVPSPIAGVPDAAWSAFCNSLVRESPMFVSQRNVGRYRHRKDRLAEIGFEPESIVGSVDAQDAAWNADLTDAHRHLAASGMLKHLGRPVSVPGPDGSERVVPVTLSGMLGLSGVAGLEGCAGWLERKADRKKFPHTTAAFLRANGAF